MDGGEGWLVKRRFACSFFLGCDFRRPKAIAPTASLVEAAALQDGAPKPTTRDPWKLRSLLRRKQKVVNVENLVKGAYPTRPASGGSGGAGREPDLEPISARKLIRPRLSIIDLDSAARALV